MTSLLAAIAVMATFEGFCVGETFQDIAEYLADEYEKTNPCGMIFEKIPDGGYAKDDRRFGNTCQAKCELNYTEAIEYGCLGPSDALRAGVLESGGILHWSKEQSYPHTYTVSDCAQSCWADPNCIHWQYGLEYAPGTIYYDETNVLRMCGHTTWRDLADIDDVDETEITGDTTMVTEQMKCSTGWTKYYKNLGMLWRYRADTDLQAKARVGQFIRSANLCACIDNPDSCVPKPIEIPEGITYVEFLTNSFGSDPCAMVVSKSNESRDQKDCMLRCRAYGPESLPETCVHGNSVIDKYLILTQGVPSDFADGASYLTPAECRLSCMEQGSDCYYWVYGPHKPDEPELADPAAAFCRLWSEDIYQKYLVPKDGDLLDYDNGCGSSRMTCDEPPSNIFNNMDRAFMNPDFRYDAQIGGFARDHYKCGDNVYFDEYIADYHDAHGYCGLVSVDVEMALQPPASYNRSRLLYCVAMCDYPAAEENCQQAHHAIDSGVYSTSGFFELPNEVKRLKSYRPVDCANDCYMSLSCAYWQYGLAYDEDLKVVDPEHVMCGHLSYKELRDLPAAPKKNLAHDGFPINLLTQRECSSGLTSYYDGLHTLWSVDDEYLRSMARISSFAGGVLCDYIDGNVASPPKPQLEDGMSYLGFLYNFYMSRDPIGCGLIIDADYNDVSSLERCLILCHTQLGYEYYPNCVTVGGPGFDTIILTQGLLHPQEELSTIPGPLTPAECRLACLRTNSDDECYFWQFGPYEDPESTEFDPTRVICTFFTISQFSEYIHPSDADIIPYDNDFNTTRLTCPHPTNVFLDLDQAFRKPESRYDARLSGFRLPADQCNVPTVLPRPTTTTTPTTIPSTIPTTTTTTTTTTPKPTTTTATTSTSRTPVTTAQPMTTPATSAATVTNGKRATTVEPSTTELKISSVTTFKPTARPKTTIKASTEERITNTDKSSSGVETTLSWLTRASAMSDPTLDPAPKQGGNTTDGCDGGQEVEVRVDVDVDVDVDA